MEKSREGLLYGLAAYGWWGLVPIYFRWLRDSHPGDILAHRVIWTVLFLAVVLTAMRRWQDLARVLRTPRLVAPLLLSALLIAANWLIFILAVANEKIAQASLGYYVTPLVSVLLGLLVFREHLRGPQLVAIGLAAAGVAILVALGGEVPWISVLGLSSTFSVYGLIRKQVPVDGLIGLAVETVVLVPPAIVYLTLYPESLENADLLGRLSLSGIVTAIPLLCFGQAARRLPLSTLGFFQYLSPTVQLLVAVLAFEEKLPRGSWVSFPLIWAALAVFSVEAVVAATRLRVVDRDLAASPDDEPQGSAATAEPRH